MPKYRLTDEQLNRLYDASKSVPYMVIGGVEPSSPRENAERVWRQVAKEHGVEYSTIYPANTGDDHDFLAEPTGVPQCTKTS